MKIDPATSERIYHYRIAKPVLTIVGLRVGKMWGMWNKPSSKPSVKENDGAYSNKKSNSQKSNSLDFIFNSDFVGIVYVWNKNTRVLGKVESYYVLL